MQFVLIDTPALSWETAEDTDEDEVIQQRARDVLVRNKGRIDRAKDPITPGEETSFLRELIYLFNDHFLFTVSQIVSRANTEDLMVFYNLPAFARGDATAFLSALSRPHGLIKKHGELDLLGAARIVLRDWSTGKFPRYTQPPASSTEHGGSAEQDGEFAELYKADEEILGAAPLRKDMRRGGGLIKLTPGDVEKRKVALDAPWDETDDEEEDEEDEEEGGEEEEAASAGDVSDDEVEGEDFEIDQDDDEESEEEVPLPTKGKRKRQEKSERSPASKKVAFAAPPKGSKQARAQSSSKTVSKPTGKKAYRK